MLGLVLLVFTIGLETNFSMMRKFGKFVFLGGLLQLFFTALAVFFLSVLFRFNFIESVFFGCAFAMSSTAVVSKIIQERGEENSLVGGLVIGILIMQDFVFIPLLIILSSLSATQSPQEIVIDIVVNVGKAALVLGLVYALGVKVIPYLFNRIAKISREYLNLCMVFFIVASLALFSYLGLSSILAAFIAGILIGQTLEHYHIFSQIRPLRDLLAIVFFVFLGLTLQPGFVIGHILPIVSFTAFVVLIKILIVLGIYLAFRFHSRTSFSISLYLFEIGEDAFILLFAGLTTGALTQESYFFALSVVVFSLLLTPVFIGKKDTWYTSVRSIIKSYLPFVENYLTYSVDRETPNIDALPMKHHVIVCGYGRVGKYVGRALMMADIPFVAIDYNFHTVETARKDGVNIIYGDPTEADVLDYAQCEEADVIIIAVPERFAQESIIFNAQRLNKKIVILGRVHRESDQRRMKDLGVESVIHPEFEASISIIRKIFLIRGIEREEIGNKIRRLKIEHGMA